MADKKQGRAAGHPPARQEVESQPTPAQPEKGEHEPPEATKGKGTEPMAANASYGQTQLARAQNIEGVTVSGEAVRRVSPENAEFLIEITASAPTAAQALRDNHLKFTQLAQALQALGLQAADLQTISQNVMNLYAPVMQSLPGYGIPQLGQPGFSGYGGGSGLAPDIQFGSYHSRNLIRVKVRDTARAGEIMDATTRAGAMVVGGVSFQTSDEATARKATLEAAGKDARMKAEILASAGGKQIGDLVSISEEFIASNGAYTAIRSAMPFTLGAGTPQMAGELEYYARVSATFRLQ